MKTKDQIKIYLRKESYFSRESVQEISQTISEKKKQGNVERVNLDFSKVIFFSRSFGDELLNLLEELEKQGISLAIQNLNSNLKMMLNHIQKTRMEIRKAMV